MSAIHHILLEVPIASVEDALAAEEGGADRLELNSALGLGGLTPSSGLLNEVRQATSLPIIAMARPRPSGFAYSITEFRTLLRDIESALSQDIDGIAFGVLHESGCIDRERCLEIIRLSGSREVVFHRAFDVVPDPTTALEQLIDLGVHRVMTSGQEANAYNGTPLLRSLIAQAAGRIEILPAGGINRYTIEDVLTRTGCDQIHASLRVPRFDRSTSVRPQVRFGSLTIIGEEQYDGTSVELVRRMRERLDEYCTKKPKEDH